MCPNKLYTIAFQKVTTSNIYPLTNASKYPESEVGREDWVGSHIEFRLNMYKDFLAGSNNTICQ